MLRHGSNFELNTYLATNTDSKLYALDLRTGALRWTFPTKAIAVARSLVHNDRVYFGSYDCNFYCVTLEGKLVWSFPTSTSSISTIDTEAYRQEFGKAEQTFTLPAIAAEPATGRYKDSGGEGGHTVYATFSAYVKESTYTSRTKRSR